MYEQLISARDGAILKPGQRCAVRVEQAWKGSRWIRGRIIGVEQHGDRQLARVRTKYLPLRLAETSGLKAWPKQ